ncbi:MAG: (4Fe-4S)-binding protein [Chloroflexi bacterium]|nr:(4Fe-4S)-binding protein [Chloroflexota bacterium]
MTTFAVEVVYRGIFQRTLSRNICRGIVLAARKEGKIGTAFGRYGDSPERNGIPAKYFAVVADDQLALEETLARYEPTEVDVTICVDDTMCKGIESWAWYGLQPINALTKQGGTLLVVSKQAPEALLEDIHRKDVPYEVGIISGPASFSGLWVYKDDHTDVRILGALAKVCPGLAGMDSYEKVIQDVWKSDPKVKSARRSHDLTLRRPIEPAEGNTSTPFSFSKPGWTEMRQALTITGVPQGGGFRGGTEGFQAARSEVFKKYSTRTMRPVINFQTCTKCTLCWLQCPDSCFDVTPDSHYDANLEACCGCGVCADVCPVDKCVTMVNEAQFNDNASQYEWFQRDQAGYLRWLDGVITRQDAEARSHGLHHWGQYKEEIAAAAASEGSR